MGITAFAERCTRGLWCSISGTKMSWGLKCSRVAGHCSILMKKTMYVFVFCGGGGKHSNSKVRGVQVGVRMSAFQVSS